jgi:serine/threonine-protein kinase
MAKLLGESPVHTVSGTPIGTPLYMSPEQARGEKVDHRSDVYALGVLCYEMLTGHLPFTGDTTVAVLMAHIIQKAPTASESAPDLSPLFDAPLASMLEKDPKLRPASAGEAVAALRRAAEQAGIAIPSPPLRLPRPDPSVSGDRLREGEPDTLLDDVAPTDPEPPQAVTGQSSARPLWPFALGLLVLGVGLGVAVLRPPSSTPKPDLTASPLAASVAAPLALAPSVALPAASSALAPVPPPSSSAAPATPTGADKKAKARSGAAARIPTDLENPF